MGRVPTTGNARQIDEITPSNDTEMDDTICHCRTSTTAIVVGNVFPRTGGLKKIINIFTMFTMLIIVCGDPPGDPDPQAENPLGYY